MRTAEEIYKYIIDNQFGTGNMIKSHARMIEQSLFGDEEVLIAWSGDYRPGGNGTMMGGHGLAGMVFALTDKRIMWAKKKMIGSVVKSINLKKVNDVSFRQELILGYLVVDSLNDTFTCILMGKNKGGQQLFNMINETLHRLGV